MSIEEQIELNAENAALRERVAELEGEDSLIVHGGKTYFVNSILHCCLRNVDRLGLMRREQNWFVAAELFGLGSESATLLCDYLGIDPESTDRTAPLPKEPTNAHD